MEKLDKRMCLLAGAAILSVVAFLAVNVNYEIVGYTMRLRVPKILAMLLTAFCLGAGSMIFQTITNNRVLTPCILGLTPLYVVIQSVIVYVFTSSSILVVNRSYNFLLSMVLMAVCSVVLYRLLFSGNHGNLLYILLIGTIAGQFFGSLSGFIQRMIDPNEFTALQSKLFASFKNINSDILILSAAAVAVILLVYRKDLKYLDVVSLGRDQAINLGVPYDAVVKRMMMAVTLLVGVATALVGPITFLGFIITNLAREIFKTYRHGYLMAGSILLGIITLAAGQTLVEHVFAFNTTLSILINLAGGIYFIVTLLWRSKE